MRVWFILHIKASINYTQPERAVDGDFLDRIVLLSFLLRSSCLVCSV